MANATDTLSPLQAYNMLLAFASRHGEHALRLAMHAALPQVLRVELLHLLRLNFVPESLLDRAVEADVLFAPFCQALSNGYYRFDPGIRLQLLQNLDPAYPNEPSPRSVQTARFLLSYFEHQDHNGMGQDRLYAEYLEVERWGALGFLKPEEAATQLAAALQQATASGEIAARLRIAGLTAALSTPLARYGRLLAYAAGLEAMESGQLGDARKLMESLGDDEIEIGAIKLQSPRRFLNEHLRPQVEAPDKLRATATNNKIYISYSRDEYFDHINRIAENLRKHFGSDRVFLADQNLVDATKFEYSFSQISSQISVMLVVIGQKWTSTATLTQTQMEMKLAEEFGIPIIPVLVGRAHLPSMKKLPGLLTKLVDIPSIELKDSAWEDDFGKLRRRIIRCLDNTRENTDSPPPQAGRSPSNHRISVYVSSTHEDLREYREAVIAALFQQGFAIGMEESAFNKQRPLDLRYMSIEESLSNERRPLDRRYMSIIGCNIYILIVAWRYGHIPLESNPNKLSITELEYRYAQKLGKPCLVFLLKPETPWPSFLNDATSIEGGDNGNRIQAFRDILMEENGTEFFDTADNLSKNVLEAMQRWKQASTTPKAKQEPQSIYSHSPESFDVYFSHNSQDKIIVKELANALRRRGLKVWLDDPPVPGEPWADTIEEKIQEIPAIAVLVGESGIGSWQNQEVKVALSRAITGHHPVIPVLLPGTQVVPELPGFLQEHTWVDMRGGLTAEGLDQLEWEITDIKPEKKDEHPRPNLTFYLSFAPEDSTAAHRLASELKELGADVVWFDRSQFKAEDEWEQKTTEAINACIYFIPLISAHTEARMEGYFYREWNLASRRLQEIAGRFVLPVMIDEADTWDISHYRGVPESFLKLQSGHAPGGALSESLRSDIAQCIREKLKESPRLA